MTKPLTTAFPVPPPFLGKTDYPRTVYGSSICTPGVRTLVLFTEITPQFEIITTRHRAVAIESRLVDSIHETQRGAVYYDPIMGDLKSTLDYVPEMTLRDNWAACGIVVCDWPEAEDDERLRPFLAELELYAMRLRKSQDLRNR